jgi:adenylate cyclase
MARSRKSRLLLRESVFAALAFTGAIYLYYLVANWGLQEFFVEGLLKEYLTGPAVHVEYVVAGVLFGAVVGIVNRFAETRWLRRKSFGLIVLIRTALYVIGLAVVAAIVMAILVATSLWPLDDLIALWRAFTLRYLFAIGIWIVLMVAGIDFLLEIRRVIGQQNLWRLFIGHYRQPRDEDRVFLFMDLEASTTAAEALGHKLYSQFIQACFEDLTMVALEYEAAIYQYVGDEVILSWPANRVGSQSDSVRAFFSYEAILAEKEGSYMERFGVVPVFRGGIDMGPVTATEIGDLKRDIAYHGDVLNTASRILDLCKERGGRLLVSDRVGDAVAVDPTVRSSWREEVVMKGKQEQTGVHSLEPVGGMEEAERDLPL